MRTEQEFIESILHMVVNFGEVKDNDKCIRRDVEAMAIQIFGGNVHVTVEYLKAQLTVEVLSHQPEYAQYITETENLQDALMAIVEDYKTTLMDSMYGKVPLTTLQDEFEVRDALGGSLSGDYHKDLKRLNAAGKTCSESLYDMAYQMDQQP